ncbi:tRNA (adenine(58)-N(1))-methyltransferase non-catalytic subunit TRM6-like isoform X2 [Physella acuta]|uniref:tRNA (adenine(58)-N(1))-methyltransferase non-catalytic subunit TRM6-like isoform X2 n=1 Tax=Physella acuta TaxID=109671 RepID=UPI0027DBEB3A|nr:tRNA (adenine(58)-N(1))-methyltransferase non-catalytic subunit TRM6-like isoform X2 [Physella acuta]
MVLDVNIKMADSVIQEGDQVVFRRAGTTRVFQIRKSRQVYFEKTKFSADELIGQSYGTTYEVEGGHLIKVEPASINVELVSAAGVDNRNLVDTEKNQKMSTEDIKKMKEDGVAGEKIITELIENSETFKSKTEYSQAKYVKKKKQKHILSFTVSRPTPRLIMEIYSKEPIKICNLRADTLAQILSYSNVRYGSNVGVVETCQGLILACVLQRMGGQGKIVNLIPNSNDNLSRDVMTYFNFSESALQNCISYPLNQLSSVKTLDDDVTCVSAGDSVVNSSPVSDAIPHDGDSVVNPSPVSDAIPHAGDLQSTHSVMISADSTQDAVLHIGQKRQLAQLDRAKKQEKKQQQLKAAGLILKHRKLDSLIIAARYNPTPILLKLLDFVPPSRPVVVYCHLLEPLVECYSQVKAKYTGAQIQLSETWYREYQVLPQRTHPMINMSGTGGYLLTFITTDPS